MPDPTRSPELNRADIKGTEYLIQIVQNIQFANLNAQAWQNETFISDTRRSVLKDVRLKLAWCQNALRQFVPLSQRESVRLEIMADDIVLQTIGLANRIMTMPPEQRDIVEAFLDGLK